MGNQVSARESMKRVVADSVFENSYFPVDLLCGEVWGSHVSSPCWLPYITVSNGSTSHLYSKCSHIP